MYEFLKKGYLHLTFTCFIPTFIAFISMMTPMLLSSRLVIEFRPTDTDMTSPFQNIFY